MTARFSRMVLMGIAALGMAACSGQSSEEVAETPAEVDSAVHPESGLPIIPVTLTTDSGAHVVQAEVANDPQSQAQGLMFRTEMGADEGMIFTYDTAAPRSFWMRNTFIPLDLIFIDADGTVVNIERGEPYVEEPVRSERDSIAVLELNAGRSEELGLEPGDQIDW